MPQIQQIDIIQQLRIEEQKGLLHQNKSNPTHTNTTIEQILNQLPDPVVIVNSKGTILFVNTSVIEITHFTKEELLGKNFFNVKITTAKSKAVLLKNLTQRMLGKTIKPYPIEVLTKEGDKLIFEINASIVTYQDKKADLVILRDINERYKAENKAKNHEKKLHTIMENLQAGIVLIEASTHKIMDINSYAANMIGLPKEEIIGNICHKFICPAEVGKCPVTDLGEKVNNSRKILLTAEGIEKPILKTVSSLVINETEYIVDSFVDLSVIEETQHALEESEQTLRTITQAAHDAIIMIDNDGNISFWNHAAEQIFQYTENEAIGKHLHHLLTPTQYHDTYQIGFSTFQKTGEGPAIGKTSELTALKKDGSEIPIELSLSAVKIQDTWHAVGVLRDITERKKTEEAIKRKNAQLERFAKLAVSRELRMKELKQQLNQIKNLKEECIV